MAALNSFGTQAVLKTSAGSFFYHRLRKLAEDGLVNLERLPFSMKIFLESALRSENGLEVVRADILRLAKYDPKKPGEETFPFNPARVLMQDFTGVPALVDLAALRSAMHRLGRDPQKINPVLAVDLIIDHSFQVDAWGRPEALQINADIEFQRNRERYEFLHWGQKAFHNFKCVPPAMGICHQVNLESLGQVVYRKTEPGLDFPLVFPDTLVGTDSHTTMINGLGVLGWGVGGIEAEAVMLGQPFYMVMPEIIGFKLSGALAPNVTATDLVLTVTNMMRKKGVVGKIIEFYGPGLKNLTLPDRATIANMSPEMGARACLFPVDGETLNYLRQTGRPAEQLDLVERYLKEQGLFYTDQTPEATYLDTAALDLATVTTCLAGPKRPQDRVALGGMKADWTAGLRKPVADRGYGLTAEQAAGTATVNYPDGTKGELKHGDVVIASITSCTNTSNPWVLLGAGLLAKNAVAKGLRVPRHVKTSLAPGSKAVTDYLRDAGLTPYLEKLGFHTVGYGCATCIGNSGPLDDHIAAAIEKADLVAAAVLSGNRNFEGRINPLTRANYLASPILVVAYALAGTVNIDLETEPLGRGANGPVFLRDIWPAADEIRANLGKARDPEIFRRVYGEIYDTNPTWNAIPSTDEAVYNWRADSTYIQEPPFFVGLKPAAEPIKPIEKARVLVKVGDSVTTDHISPAGNIPAKTPAGQYLIAQGVKPADFNSFGSRRGNDRVMTRGTFANIRIRNQVAPGTEGGVTTHFPSGDVLPIYEASLRYKKDGVPTVVLAGVDYGMGSSRDWAAKGTTLLGVHAVIARSFEIIHRANLVGMGVLPLQFRAGESAESLGLTGRETYTIHIDDHLEPGQTVQVDAASDDGAKKTFATKCRVDSRIEVEYYRHGGILNLALRRMSQS